MEIAYTKGLLIRKYQSSDCKEITELFYNTVHTVNAKDYSKDQLDVWATGQIDLENWNRSFLDHYSVVAVDDKSIVGFGDIDKTGYLDRLFVHKDYQRRGIASAICDELEQAFDEKKIITHASITAKPFFEQRGYKVVKEQQVVRNGITLTNYLMEKNDKMNYKVIDKTKYYRAGVYRHFTQDCKCSTSMTARIDVSRLVSYSKQSGTKFYINFLYLLCNVLNSRDDYKMGYLWQTEELICYDRIHPTQYVFHEDTETCTPVYSMYYENYEQFYKCALADIETAKKTTDYGLDMEHHPNWFDASFISWLSYDSLNIELPDGHLFFAPIVNWGKYREEGGKLMMPVSVRLNHAIADGFLVANVFRLLEKEIDVFCENGL